MLGIAEIVSIDGDFSNIAAERNALDLDREQRHGLILHFRRVGFCRETRWRDFEFARIEMSGRSSRTLSTRTKS